MLRHEDAAIIEVGSNLIPQVRFFDDLGFD